MVKHKIDLQCINTIDCQQGAVRAVRFNGKENQTSSLSTFAIITDKNT